MEFWLLQNGLACVSVWFARHNQEAYSWQPLVQDNTGLWVSFGSLVDSHHHWNYPVGATQIEASRILDHQHHKGSDLDCSFCFGHNSGLEEWICWFDYPRCNFVVSRMVRPQGRSTSLTVVGLQSCFLTTSFIRIHYFPQTPNWKAL